ncbi:hypothetical protein QJS04_geneDACA008728 [Acorus gramineus]|uniref:Protein TRIGALACTOSYLDIACYLGLYCEROL 4, chloroplastic n=1 Tax=Acorus gramineus TaxID=55184 RepID=A0AAV9ADZ1_ACOGR|nr:hypothetical protein QJS04_geneDACA008728 [Acorus gramineus]
MASMRNAMDALFWDMNLSTPRTLDGSARLVPGEPVPVGVARSSRILRVQQLSFLGDGFPLGLVPSFSPPSLKELGSFSLQSLLFRPAASDWWMGLVGQFRPKKLISSIKSEITGVEELELLSLKDVAKHFLDKSLYSLGLCTQVSPGPDSSLYFTTEAHGDKKGHRSKLMLYHKLPYHDVTLEAAWPALFIDGKGTYWDAPASVSLDLQSLVSDSGLRYRFGLHKNGGYPQPLNGTCDNVPLALMPGFFAKAAFSYERTMDLWRQKEKKSDIIVENKKGKFLWTSYDMRMREPHAAISGILGGTCVALLEGKGELKDGSPLNAKQRYPFTADLFGSACFTYQHGKFRKRYKDLTRIDARLDICSASAFMRGAANLISGASETSAKKEVNPLASPRLNLIFQQQVFGPIIARVDSRLSFNDPSGKHIPHVEDNVYSLSVSLKMLDSGKILAWYSPKRKEAMVELRLYDF